LLPSPILENIGAALNDGDMSNVGWIPSGWSVSSAVSFSLAGSLSDIYGRKHVIMAGEFLTLIGAVSLFYSAFQSTYTLIFWQRY